jgi:hypothetical protein
MQAVAGNSVGYDITLAFLKQHKETIIRRFGTGLIGSAITTLSTQINNPIESQEVIDGLGRFTCKSNNALYEIAVGAFC